MFDRTAPVNALPTGFGVHLCSYGKCPQYNNGICELLQLPAQSVCIPVMGIFIDDTAKLVDAAVLTDKVLGVVMKHSETDSVKRLIGEYQADLQRALKPFLGGEAKAQAAD
jgi:hypothetical protein